MNIRIAPPILLILGSFVFIFFAVNQTKNKTSNNLKAATSQNITIVGKLEKYGTCLSENICHFVVDQGIKYNLYGAKYPNVSESFPSLDAVSGKSVQITGIWLDGKNPYLIIISLTSL
jgi:hypothetical protein